MERKFFAMEMKIRNGDYVPDGTGGMARLTGSDAMLQRVLYKLTARRGAFPFLPELGSDLYRLGTLSARERKSAAEQYVRQALDGEAELTVEEVSLSERGGGLYDLTVTLGSTGQTFELTLTVQ